MLDTYYIKSLSEYKDATMSPDFIYAMAVNDLIKVMVIEDESGFVALPALDQVRNGNKVLRSAFTYCNLLSNMNPVPIDYIQDLKTSIRQWMTGNGYKSLYMPINPFNSDTIAYSELLDIQYNRKIVYVDLTKPEEQIDQEIHIKHRHLIKKALGCGLKVVSDKNYFDAFIRLYTQTMDKHNAQKSYYYNVNDLSSILETNTLLTCLLNGKPIASSIFIHSQHNKVVHYFLSGNDTEYRHLSPNTLLLYIAIKYFRDKNYKVLNLGGKHADNELLYKYKQRFSNTHKDFYIGELLV